MILGEFNQIENYIGSGIDAYKGWIYDPEKYIKGRLKKEKVYIKVLSGRRFVDVHTYPKGIENKESWERHDWSTDMQKMAKEAASLGMPEK